MFEISPKHYIIRTFVSNKLKNEFLLISNNSDIFLLKIYFSTSTTERFSNHFIEVVSFTGFIALLPPDKQAVGDGVKRRFWLAKTTYKFHVIFTDFIALLTSASAIKVGARDFISSDSLLPGQIFSWIYNF